MPANCDSRCRLGVASATAKALTRAATDGGSKSVPAWSSNSATASTTLRAGRYARSPTYSVSTARTRSLVWTMSTTKTADEMMAAVRNVIAMARATSRGGRLTGAAPAG